MNLEDFDRIVRLYRELGGRFKDLGEMVFEVVHKFLWEKYQGKTVFLDENDLDSFVSVSESIERYPSLELREVKKEVELEFAGENGFREAMISLGNGTGRYKDGTEMPKPGPVKLALGFYMVKEPTSLDIPGYLIPLRADLNTAKKIMELEAMLGPIEREWIQAHKARSHR